MASQRATDIDFFPYPTICLTTWLVRERIFKDLVDVGLVSPIFTK